jgi:hypothetical protein
MKTIKFSPDEKLAEKMPPKERQRTAALLNVHTESETDNAVRFLIDVGFQSVMVKRPLLKGNWFVACRSALISLQIDEGKLRSNSITNLMVPAKRKLAGSLSRQSRWALKARKPRSASSA